MLDFYSEFLYLFVVDFKKNVAAKVMLIEGDEKWTNKRTIA
jgi:hypothetical protein